MFFHSEEIKQYPHTLYLYDVQIFLGLMPLYAIPRFYTE